MAGTEDSVTIREGGEGPATGQAVPQGPIEPEGREGGRKFGLRLILLLLFIIYALLHVYHGPILERAGSFLVISHEPEPGDVIVCLSGREVECGLAAADLYQKDIAPIVFIFHQAPPDGYGILKEAGIEYPLGADLLRRILEGRGVPGSAILESDKPVVDLEGEASFVDSLASEKDYESVVLAASPMRSRRAWRTFRKVMKAKGIRVQVVASSYSGFDPKGWWKDPRYRGEVVSEYQKLTVQWFGDLF